MCTPGLHCSILIFSCDSVKVSVTAVKTNMTTQPASSQCRRLTISDESSDFPVCWSPFGSTLALECHTDCSLTVSKKVDWSIQCSRMGFEVLTEPPCPNFSNLSLTARALKPKNIGEGNWIIVLSSVECSDQLAGLVGPAVRWSLNAKLQKSTNLLSFKRWHDGKHLARESGTSWFHLISFCHTWHDWRWMFVNGWKDQPKQWNSTCSMMRTVPVLLIFKQNPIVLLNRHFH